MSTQDACPTIEGATIFPNQPSQRKLLVIADDFGIGPEVSRAILELAHLQLVSGSVLLVNSPFAEAAVESWRKAGRPMELGWHPCFTLDRPILPPQQVPSLTRPDGRFLSLGRLMSRLFLGRVNAGEVEAELRAQLQRFVDLVGAPPTHVNSHQHVSIFQPIRQCLLKLMLRQQPLPYVRRVQEPWSMLRSIRGARTKRIFLNHFGRKDARTLEAYGVPGNDWLAGITDPPWSAQPEFFEAWLRAIPGRVVELSCHPGHADTTLIGRDCTPTDGMLQRRINERGLLLRPEFLAVVQEAGFSLTTPALLTKGLARHAA